VRIQFKLEFYGLGLWCFNTTFNNISVISYNFKQFLCCQFLLQFMYVLAHIKCQNKT
jgi:hypothetical protein